jgi:hypothetical protein
MKTTSIRIGLVLSVLATANWAIAQDAQQDQGSWRRLGGPSVGDTAEPNQGPPPNYQQGRPPQYSRQEPPPNYQQGPPPGQLTIAPGTYLTVRVNQALSSDHNQQGDAFSASLVKPLVVDGFIVADRGQTIGGRVTEAQKAGRVKGTSRLGIELIDLSLVDGQQVPLHTQLVSRNGSTSVGRDAAAIGTTTAVGAAVGAAADWGRGAAIGAGAGAAAGVLGVLLTRGNPTVIYPESVLTFRVENPIAVSTERSPQAFRTVGPGDYDQPQDQPRLARRPPPPPFYGGGYPYYGPYYGYGWGYPYPYYWGPSIGFYGRFGGRRWR